MTDKQHRERGVSSEGREFFGIGVWAYRRVGAWARRHARRGRVALLRDRRCKFGKFSFADYAAQLFILDCPIVDAFRTCNDGRAGAQPYPVTCADTPTRLRG